MSCGVQSVVAHGRPSRTLVFLFRLFGPFRITCVTHLGLLVPWHGGGRSSCDAVEAVENHFCTGASVAPLTGDNTIYIDRLLYFLLFGIVWRRIEKLDFVALSPRLSVQNSLRWAVAVVFGMGRPLRSRGPLHGPRRPFSVPPSKQHGVVL